MVKPASTLGTCCYIGCKKRFLTDKETRFFHFPDDLERRKKWITNCGNPELGTMAERQLRGKKICINHFPPRAFTSNGNALKDTAVPTPTTTPPIVKTSIAVNKPNPQIKNNLDALKTPKKVRFATMVQTRSSTPASSSIKASAELVLNKSIVTTSKKDMTAPTTVPVVAKKGKGRPPKIIREVAVKSKLIDVPEIPEVPIIHLEPKIIENSRKHNLMSSLVLVDDASAASSASETPIEIQKAIIPPAATKKRKYTKLKNAEENLKSKLRKIAVEILQPRHDGLNVEISSGYSDEEGDGDSDYICSSVGEKQINGSDKAFARFHKVLKGSVDLPESWSLGALLWDASKKMKVISASELDVSANGTVCLKRCVQIYETMQTKVTIDGFDLTHRYDVKEVSEHKDVTRLILQVARSKICSGIQNVSKEDAVNFTDAIPRGTTIYSEACPVIIGKQSLSIGSLCSSCHKLGTAIRRRKAEQKRAIEMRRAKRPSLDVAKSPFGKALYSLLSNLMTDDIDSKSKKKKGLSTLYSRGHNVCRKDNDKEGEPTQKVAPERATNFASISYKIQDIVSKMSFGKTPQEPPPKFIKTEKDDIEMQIINGSVDPNSGNLVVQKAADFTLAEGQEYELIGEVDPSDVQVVEMIKERPEAPPQYQIIPVDYHTLAQMNYGGMILQSTDGQIVNVTDMDMNQSMGQFLKSNILQCD